MNKWMDGCFNEQQLMMMIMVIIVSEDDNDDSYGDSNNCSRYSYLSNNIFLFSSISTC